MNNYKEFDHISEVWDYIEAATSEEDLKIRISSLDPIQWGSISYEMHDDGNGALVTIDYNGEDDEYYEKVDVYFDKDEDDEEDELM